MTKAKKPDQKKTVALPVIHEKSKLPDKCYTLTLDLQQTAADVDLSFDNRTHMTVDGNSKVGEEVRTFSLPPVITCPTATPSCLKSCYAVNYTRQYAGVSLVYMRNLAATQQPWFVSRMVGELISNNVKVLRLHASGELYDVKYIRKWISIARAVPTVIYCYTRSWRHAGNRAALEEFAALPNVKLWLSVDKDSRDVPTIPNTRIAYMSIGNDDRPVPGSDLVFKTSQRNQVTIKMDGVLVCPVENGTKAGHNLTCADCKFCFNAGFKRPAARVA